MIARVIDALSIFVILAIIALVIAACSSTVNPNTAGELAKRQRAIQECILLGGHPRLGPDNSIICR